MYKNSFLHSCKKTMHPIFTKINRVCLTTTWNIPTKFELNRMYRLDAIVVTHIHTHIHTHTLPRKQHKWIPETWKRINASKSQSRIFSRLQYFLYIVYVRKVNKHVNIVPKKKKKSDSSSRRKLKTCLRINGKKIRLCRRGWILSNNKLYIIKSSWHWK